MRAPRRLLPLVLASALVIAACGGDDGGDSADTAAPTTAPSTEAPTTEPPATEPPATDPPTTTAAPTTTVDLAAAAYAYTEPGEHPVGVTTLQLPSGNLVEIWYPAVAGRTGTETYDMRDFVPPAITALLTGDAPSTLTYDAARDAEVAEGTFPVVGFSHGASAMRLQSTFLTAHLASYGMIVVSADHPTRALYNVLEGTAQSATQDAVTDLLGAIELVAVQNETPGALLEGHADLERVGLVGHSAGGGTVLAAAENPLVDTYVSLASGAFRGGASDDSTTTTAAPLPDKPSFLMAGALDAIVSPEERTRPAFEAAPAPSRLWIIDGVGHNGFDDFCTFGNGTGIIGIAEASGLGALLDSLPNLRRLGEDGCVPPAVPVTDSFPIIQHAVTAHLLWQFGVDAEPVGLGPEVADQYPLAVEIQVKD